MVIGKETRNRGTSGTDLSLRENVGEAHRREEGRRIME